VLRSAQETGGKFVVLEDHLTYGGLATRISDVITDNNIALASFERLGIPQVYAGFGEDEELRDKYGYGLTHTIEALRRAVGKTGEIA
jgi:transketolase